MTTDFTNASPQAWPSWLREAVARYPSPVIARDQVGVFTGGLINPRTVANHDSLGIGPRERVHVGRRTGYTLVSFADYVAGRCGAAA